MSPEEPPAPPAAAPSTSVMSVSPDTKVETEDVGDNDLGCFAMYSSQISLAERLRPPSAVVIDGDVVLLQFLFANELRRCSDVYL